MEDNQKEPLTTGRFYTSARRIKQVLGSLPDGTKIPGGPYTYTQIGVMIALLVLGWITRGLWGSGSTIGDLIVLLVVSFGAGFVAGKLPQSRRNPIRLLGSAFTLITHPGPGGHWRGRPLRLKLKAQRIQRQAMARDKTKSVAKNGPMIKVDSSSEQEIQQKFEPNFGSSLNRVLADQTSSTPERHE